MFAYVVVNVLDIVFRKHQHLFSVPLQVDQQCRPLFVLHNNNLFSQKASRTYRVYFSSPDLPPSSHFIMLGRSVHKRRHPTPPPTDSDAAAEISSLSTKRLRLREGRGRSPRIDSQEEESTRHVNAAPSMQRRTLPSQIEQRSSQPHLLGQNTSAQVHSVWNRISLQQGQGTLRPLELLC